MKNISRDGLPNSIITTKGAAGRFSALTADKDNISQNPDNASGENPKLRFSVGEVWTGSAADYDQPSLPFRRRSLSYGGTSQRGGFLEELILPSGAQFY